MLILSFKWGNYHRFFGKQFHYSCIYLKWYLGADNGCSFRLRISLNLLIKQKETLSGSRFYLLLVVYSAESHLIFLIQIIYEIKAKVWYTYKNTDRVAVKWDAQQKWMIYGPIRKSACIYKQLGNVYYCRIPLYLIEFTSKALSACKLYTVHSITSQLFGTTNIFSRGKNVTSVNYLPRQEHKRLLNV